MFDQLHTQEINAPLGKIKTGRFQQRQNFDVTEMKSLVQSIKAEGLLSLPLVTAVNGHYELVYGDRRRRALCALALMSDGQTLDQALAAVCGPLVDQLPDRFAILHRVTVKVKLSWESDPVALQIMGTIENLQRADLSPLETAQGYQGLLDAGLSRELIVEKTGASWSRVQQYLDLLSLPPKIQTYFDRKLLPLTALTDLLRLPAELQIEVAEKMAGRTSRDIRAVIKLVNRGLPASPTGEAAPSALPEPENPKPANLRDQLAETKQIITLLTGQLYLDARLLAQCAEALQECTPDSRLVVMARARARQIEQSLKRGRQAPSEGQLKRSAKIETFIKKRSKP